MPSPLKKIDTHTFTEGLDTVTAKELLPPTKAKYMLNCNILSTGDGNVGVVTNIKGNKLIYNVLPAGQNITIGHANDEEKNNFYFAVWNSEGFHTWYRYNSVDNSIIQVYQDLTDTGDIQTFNWIKGNLILHADVIDNNKLYWVIEGDIARKININKCLDKTENGYGGQILEEYSRAYKKTSNYAPSVEYVSDSNQPFNRLYGYQFKFAQSFIYDDNEESHVSDYSKVANPDKEAFTGTTTTPTENNGLDVTVDTGSNIVNKIKLFMQKTNPEGGVFEWVLVATIDKKRLGLASNSNYVFRFFNDGTYLPADPKKIIKPFNYLPSKPITQSKAKSSLVYGNFDEGFEKVDIDVQVVPTFDDLFIEQGTINEFNNPFFECENGAVDYIESKSTVTKYDGSTYNSYRGARFRRHTLTIGADVKSGNIFKLSLYSGDSADKFDISVTATITDSASSIAGKLTQKLIDTGRIHKKVPAIPESNIYTRTINGDGSVSFSYIFKSNNDKYVSGSASVNPVQYNTLKDTGESKKIQKMGSVRKLGYMYEDEEGGRKSLVYTNDEQTYKVPTINVLGKPKTTKLTLTVNHKPPIWAKFMQVMVSPDLVYDNFIDIFIQKVVKVKGTQSDNYLDLQVGSLYTFQKLHPNSSLKYEFKKGDRVRFIKKIDPETATEVYYDFYETEVISYTDTVTTVINQNITVDGTNSVLVDGVVSEDNIDNYILINGVERKIESVDIPNNKYLLDNSLAGAGDDGTTAKKYPTFTIINRNGALRIKDTDIIDITDNSLVEVYTPASIIDGNNQFFEFGYKFPINAYGTENRAHYGDIQLQTDTQPAIITINTGFTYVRNRELPTNNQVPNTQVYVSVVEAEQYSDFYESRMTDLGRPNVEDNGLGVVHFGSRFRFSNNAIEDTGINGLNSFDNLDRVDYNDAYGDAKRTYIYGNRMYVMKSLRACWAPVGQTIITDESSQSLIGSSSKLLGNIQYFALDAGIGNHPEAFVANENHIYYLSPNINAIVRIGGDGETPISKIYYLDNVIGQYIKDAQKNSSKIYFGFDKNTDNLIVAFAQSVNYISVGVFDTSWQTLDALPPTINTYTIVTYPAHGTLDLTDPKFPIYEPETGYLGNDSFIYSSVIDGTTVTKKACIEVMPLVQNYSWRVKSSTAYCITENGDRTGYQGWETLEQYGLIDGVLTGVEKPNLSKDVDYVAPVFNSDICKPAKWVVQESTAYCKTTPDPKWVVDEDSASCVQEGAVLPDFDYVVIDYSWQPEAGSDLDTFTGLIDTGTAYDNDWVGYGQGDAKVPSGSATPYLWFAGDNTSGGRETSLVDFNKFIADNPSVAELIKIRMNAVWFSGKLTGEISIGIVTYKGGTMSLDAPNHNFVNTGGVVVSTESIPVTVTFSSSSGDISNSQDLAILTYNKTTNSATLNLV